MARSRRIPLLFVLVAVVGLAGLATPSCAVACTCAAPLPGIAAYTGPGDAVLVGRVGNDDGTGVFAFHVERWFHGGDGAVVGLASASRRQPDGTWAMNTCGVSLRAGDHLFLAAQRAAAIYTPSACSPIASADSPEGLTMIADAERAFGPGRAPGVAPPSGELDPGGVLIVGFGIVVFVVISVVAFARRQRSA